ncbi:D-aminoacylase, partial [Streptomyces sp. SID11233]|nr:D-aminoacylase [Streptomyces sp. SID11233]
MPAAALPSPVPAPELLVRDALVVDGSGQEPYRADVLLREGRIAGIGREGGARLSAARTLDADGLALSPGFIDMHA